MQSEQHFSRRQRALCQLDSGQFFAFFEGKIIAIIKKCNLNNIFHEGKGHFATGERALFVFSENLGGAFLCALVTCQ
jgi:hypothetical protein